MEQFVKFDSKRIHDKPVSNMIISHVLGIIESPVKSLAATVTGFITSFIPMVITEAIGSSYNHVELFLQLGVLIVTLLLGITSLITWWQKQNDRRKKLAEEKLKLKDDDKN